MENIFDLMIEYLRKRGIVADTNDRKLISFSVNNLHYIFEVFEPDQFFFRMSLPQITNNVQALNQLSDDIQNLNRNFKVAKIVSQENHELRIIADQFVFSTSQIDSLFERVIQAMGDMIKEYHQMEIKRNNGTEEHQ